MGNLDIYNAFRSVPQNAQKPINAGRLKGKTDINPMWRIKALTEQFGACGIGWYYEVTRQWTEVCGDEVCAFVNIQLYIKVDGEWSKPIFGIGGNKLIEKESKGLHVSDECFKMATTDAISVACKQLGIGADVYWKDDKSKYENAQEETSEFEARRLKPVLDELARIGYSTTSICKTYKIDSIENMSDLQIKDFLAKAKSVPDKQQLKPCEGQ
jgi:hypothetical protein